MRRSRKLGILKLRKGLGSMKEIGMGLIKIRGDMCIKFCVEEGNNYNEK
jgi:hypothetical protein